MYMGKIVEDGYPPKNGHNFFNFIATLHWMCPLWTGQSYLPATSIVSTVREYSIHYNNIFNCVTMHYGIEAKMKFFHALV